ncbi:DinB family protein [Mucilaginibacter sp. HC2]|uniref:DinB family protein n=1 Tax=Mucilaginibacter inviolabilis TaxID=2714892 RepID=UPI00140D1056|nr:DinB family protein [Mucilaginibacter inviolabilis]NHA02924.1 DinB family protein [Mucilaginibacter inviolabilis]
MNHVVEELNTILNEFQDIKSQAIDWETRPASGKWSKKEILGHLIDSAQINLQRFIRCTYEENFRLTYEQDAWVTAQAYQSADIKDLTDLWTLLNKQIISVLKNYPLDRVDVRCDNSKLEPNLQTVTWLANDYVEHLKHHLKQITS